MSLDTSIRSASSDVMRANGLLQAAQLKNLPDEEIDSRRKDLATAKIILHVHKARATSGPLESEQVARIVDACTAT